MNQFDGFQSHSCCKHTIGRGRGAASLDMTKHSHSRFDTHHLLDSLAEPIADPAELLMSEFIQVTAFGDGVLLDGRRTFGDHDDGELAASVDPLPDQVADFMEIKLTLGHENAVG